MKRKVKIAFLDRDGVINSSQINNGYVGLIKDFKWIKGSKSAIKYLKLKKYKIIIVTNQSGIARGYFSLRDVYKLHNYLKSELKNFGAKIDKIYFCPYHKDGIVKKYSKKSDLRKPNIGMFKKAKKIYKIDLENSFMVGDQNTDIQFAKKAGIKGYLFNEDNLYKFEKKFIR